MKKLTLLFGTIAMCLALSLNMTAQTKNKGTKEAIDNLKAYPETIDSLVRHVIYLELMADESLFEIELIAGKTLSVDCNRHRLIGSFSEETVQGWGYNYFVFSTENHVASTMMMCPDGVKTDKFISGESISARYNSRLPIVVYLPKDCELKYRIWTAGELLSVDKE